MNVSMQTIKDVQQDLGWHLQDILSTYVPVLRAILTVDLRSDSSLYTYSNTRKHHQRLRLKVKAKKVKGMYSSSWEPISELWGVTCHTGSHSVFYLGLATNSSTQVYICG